MNEQEKIKKEITRQEDKLPLGSKNWDVNIAENNSTYKKIQCSQYNTSSLIVSSFYKPMRNY